MRRWYKYWIDPNVKGAVRVAQDQDFEAHETSMGGYDAGSGYGSPDEFFDAYLFGYQLGRLEDYDDFLRAHLLKDGRALSIAAGRCASELYLVRDGWRIVCSDLAEPEALPRTRRLFPDLEFAALDILAGPAPERFDAVMCLSLIYLFDDAALARFFDNVAASLAPGGQFILDSAGSPDNRLSWFIHDVWLPAEVRLKQLIKLVTTGKWYGFVVKEFGYRRTDDEIVALAEASGFRLVDKAHYALTAEFKRSSILTRLIRPGSIFELWAQRLGRRIPYVRMFEFLLEQEGAGAREG